MPRLTRSQFIILAALITLAAALVRLAGISHIPPGLHFDEAANGLIVRNIAFEGYRPLFIPEYTGKEVLWFYAAALLTRVAGASIFTLRLTSTFLGVLTVPLTGWVVCKLYRDDDRRNWFALLAMAVLAVAFWHGVLSRLAFRAVSQPMMQAVAIGLLFHALRTELGTLGRVSSMLAAGAATGLVAYTYLAARLFLIPIAIVLLVVVIFDRERLKHIIGFGAFGLGAILTFAPLGIYFLQNPERFSTRINQVAPQSTLEALDGWRGAFGMLFFEGDPLLRFNIPGLPMFGVLLGVLAVLGFGALVWETLHEAEPVKQARNVLLLVWPLVMLAPTALATGGITPSNLRAVGLAPLIAIYPALGAVVLVSWVRRPVARLIPAAALALVTLGSGAFTVVRTFNWGQETLLYYDNDGHIAALARYMEEEIPQGPLYLSAGHFQHPTLRYLSERARGASHLFGGQALVAPPQGESLMAFTRNSSFPQDWREPLSPYLVATADGPDATPDFWVYQISSDAPFWPAERSLANYANIIVLDGAQFYPATAGGAAYLDAAWRVIGQPDLTDYVFSAEVCDPWGWCWVKANRDGSLERGRNDTYLSSQWAVGERILTRIEIPLPEGIPPGEYTVQLRVFSTGEQRALPVVDEAQGFAGFTAEVGPVNIRPNASADLMHLPVQFRTDIAVTDSITLLGYDYPNQTARPGEQLGLALYWVATGVTEENLPVTLSLSDGTVLVERLPVRGTYPTAAWLPGELVVDRYAERIPFDLEPGDYTLYAQLGDSERIELGPLAVEATERLFRLPDDALTPALDEVIYGGQIALLGFDAPDSAQPGEVIDVQLAWQALEEVDRAYTTFVHLVNEAGEIVTQRDRPPIVDGRIYPADLWLAGEVVVDDPYSLTLPVDLPPGDYQLRVGVYLPESGQQLSLPGSDDNAYYLPLTITIR